MPEFHSHVIKQGVVAKAPYAESLLTSDKNTKTAALLKGVRLAATAFLNPTGITNIAGTNH